MSECARYSSYEPVTLDHDASYALEEVPAPPIDPITPAASITKPTGYGVFGESPLKFTVLAGRKEVSALLDDGDKAWDTLHNSQAATMKNHVIAAMAQWQRDGYAGARSATLLMLGLSDEDIETWEELMNQEVTADEDSGLSDKQMRAQFNDLASLMRPHEYASFYGRFQSDRVKAAMTDVIDQFTDPAKQTALQVEKARLELGQLVFDATSPATGDKAAARYKLNNYVADMKAGAFTQLLKLEPEQNRERILETVNFALVMRNWSAQDYLQFALTANPEGRGFNLSDGAEPLLKKIVAEKKPDELARIVQQMQTNSEAGSLRNGLSAAILNNGDATLQIEFARASAKLVVQEFKKAPAGFVGTEATDAARYLARWMNRATQTDSITGPNKQEMFNAVHEHLTVAARVYLQMELTQESSGQSLALWNNAASATR